MTRPLPASVAAVALRRALAGPFPRQRTSLTSLRNYSMVAITFLLCARPGSVRDLKVHDVRIGRKEVGVQLRRFKYSESGLVPLIALRIPVRGLEDPFSILFRRLTQAASPNGFLFPSRARSQGATAQLMSNTVAASLADTGTLPPLGFKFTPRSLRSGGISAAYAAGVPLDIIMRFF